MVRCDNVAHGRMRKGRTAEEGMATVAATMEIGNRIREHRAALAMSQDDLAARVYMSRQTISSWENGKTYPDVQSLLLLSEIFGATVDSLIKGDVETMHKTLDHDAIIIRRLGFAMLGLLALVLMAVAWFTVQLTVWNWDLGQTVPTILLALALWGAAMFAAIWTEHIKRDHDLVAYREVSDFMNGNEPDRDTERGRRERALPNWMRVIRAVGWALIAAAVGFLCARYGLPLLQGLFG